MTDFGTLAQVLREERATILKMLGMEEEKTRALVSGDAQALLSVLGTQQALIMAQKALEEKRIALSGAWKEPTLAALIDANPACRAELEPIFTELQNAVLKLKKKNNRNQKLLETRLSTIRFMNEKLGIGVPNTYGKGVQVKA